MEIIIPVILIILLIILAVLLVNSIFGPFLNKKLTLSSVPKISVLVPARNEADNIARCIEHLAQQKYSNKEIIILDDNSTDNTKAIVEESKKLHPEIKLISGQPLPAGWTGKNWACHQLAEKARGEILIFTDADTMHNPLAVKRTVAWMQKLKTGMLSAFPQQITGTLSESLIVPMIDFLVYGLLPLWATFFIRLPALSAANGQWIAFTREAYRKAGGHKSVRTEMVEDVELNKLAKRKGIKTITTAGTDMVFCRMYKSAKEVWQGFTKIFFGLSGNSVPVFLFIETFLLLGCVLPYFLLIIFPDTFLILLSLGLNIIIRLILSVRYKHPVWVSILLHPLAIVYATIIGFNAVYQYYWGQFQWKDRIIITKIKPNQK